MEEIVCLTCTETKHPMMFAGAGRPRKDGTQVVILQPCITCREKIRRKKNFNVRTEVLEHYANGNMACKCCGEPNYAFLTLDHINGDGAEERLKYGPRFWRSIIIRNYPPIYQILCMNCNWAKGRLGECPHKANNQID
jgi:hypothetical protein